jgi:hypothetical protein
MVQNYTIENYTNSAISWAHEQQDLSNSSVSSDLSGNIIKKDLSGNIIKKDLSGNTNSTSINKLDLSGNIYKLENDTQSLILTIFSKSNIILIIWFLAIYFIVYFLLGFFIKSDNQSSNYNARLSNVLDILILSIILFFLISYYYTSTDDQKGNLLKNTYTTITDYVDTPSSIFSTSLFIFLFYITVYLFRFPMTSDTKPIFISIIESIAWILFVIICFVDFFKYILGISLIDMLNEYFFIKLPNKYNDIALPKLDISLNLPKNEVFNVSNNLYTYDDAQSICTAYGAKLATYDQVEDAYNKGGEWCNYGWSDGQMILFPTQKSTWNDLQKNEKHKNDCGRPGVNGGYIANPYMKFGVNCYGKKPKPTDNDLNRMTAKQNHVFPKTKEEIELDSKISYWKDNADKLLQINSYNTKKWSEY